MDAITSLNLDTALLDGMETEALRLEKEYGISPEKLGQIIRFECIMNLDGAKFKVNTPGNNIAQVGVLNEVSNDLLGIPPIYGFGKIAGIAIPPGGKFPESSYKYGCNHTIFPDTLLLPNKENEKQEIYGSIVACLIGSELSKIRYLYISRPGDEQTGDSKRFQTDEDLDASCNCKKLRCSLPDSFSIENAYEIGMEGVYGQFVKRLQAKIPRYEEVVEDLKKELIPNSRNIAEQIIKPFIFPQKKDQDPQLGYFG